MYKEFIKENLKIQRIGFLREYKFIIKAFDLIDSIYKDEGYKRKYELITKIVQPKNFEIHHIDSNRENNHMMNLVLLPIKLHREYHKRKKHIIPIKGQVIPDGLLCDTELYNNCGADVMPDLDILEKYKRFFEIQQVCCNWVYLRDCILGLDDYVFDTFDYEKLYESNNKFKLK